MNPFWIIWWTLNQPAFVLSASGENRGGGSHVKSESKEVMMQPYAVKNDRNCSKLSERGEERSPCSGGTQRTWLASLSAADTPPPPTPVFPTSKPEVIC